MLKPKKQKPTVASACACRPAQHYKVPTQGPSTYIKVLTYGALEGVYTCAHHIELNNNDRLKGPWMLRHHSQRRLPVLASRMRCYCCCVVCFDLNQRTRKLRAPAYGQGKYYGGLQQGRAIFTGQMRRLAANAGPPCL